MFISIPGTEQVDLGSYYELKWAREGWRDHALVRHNGIDCAARECATQERQ